MRARHAMRPGRLARALSRALAAAFVATGAAACGRGGDAPADDAAGGSGIVVERGPSGFHGTEMPATVPTPAMRLVEHGGEAFDLAAQRGRVVLLFFGYTHCPDICPTTLADWRQVKRALGADTARVRFVFVTTDPARDTPEVAQRYARQFDPSFVGLSGTQAELDALQRGFMIASYREPPRDSAHAGHGGYTVAHASRVFVVDPSGRWRLVLPAGAGARAMAADVRRLLAE